MQVHRVGTYSLDYDAYILILCVEFGDLTPTPTPKEIVSWLADHTDYHYVPLGVEGCPGRWFINYVECVYINPISRYALVQVEYMQDV